MPWNQRGKAVSVQGDNPKKQPLHSIPNRTLRPGVRVCVDPYGRLPVSRRDGDGHCCLAVVLPAGRETALVGDHRRCCRAEGESVSAGRSAKAREHFTARSARLYPKVRDGSGWPEFS